MTTRRTLLSAAATCHLLLVLAGGFDLCLWEFGPPGRVLGRYSAASGAAAGYSYFAPGVGAPLRAEFTLVAADGSTRRGDLPPHLTREADIRYEHIAELAGEPELDRAGREALARSWAAAMFARHPDVTRLALDVGRDRVRSMAAVRRGDAPRWRSDLRARIARATAERGAP